MRGKKLLVALPVSVILAAAPVYSQALSPSAPSEAVEQQFDAILASAYPQFAEVRSELQSGRLASLFQSTTYEPFSTISIRKVPGVFTVSGVTASGHAMKMKILRARSEYKTVWSVDGGDILSLEFLPPTIDLATGEIVHRSRIVDVERPMYSVELDVHEGQRLGAVRPGTGTLVLTVNGKTTRVRLAPGLANSELTSMLSAAAMGLPPRKLPLLNFFSLALADPSVSARVARFESLLQGLHSDEGGVSQIEWWGRKSDSDPTQVGRPQHKSSSLHTQKITNEEAYWCGVGTIGADAVFTLGGSFLYGALCGALADEG